MLLGDGQTAAAWAAFATAIRIKRDYAYARLNAGRMLYSLGRRADAIAAFEAMTTACPRDARGFYNLAICLTEEPADDTRTNDTRAGDARAGHAREAFMAAIARDPRNADILRAAGIFLGRQGDLASAVEYLQRALASASWTSHVRAEVTSNLGEFLRQDQRFSDAVTSQRAALALSPSHRDIRYNLAAALQSAGETPEAANFYRELIRSDPDFVRPYVNLGLIYKMKGRLDDAMALFEDALFIDPLLSQAYSNIGACFVEEGWTVSGLVLHDRAIALNDVNPEGRYARGAAHLLTGQFARGWGEYEFRFDAPEAFVRRPSPPAYWRGEDLTGKRVLIWTDQGLGDEMIFASMIPDMLARAKQCVIECSPRLVPIFARSFPSAQVVGWTDPRHRITPADAIDCQIAASSLGLYLRPDLASVPRRAGYLRADPAKIAERRALYMTHAAGRRIVGISWRSRHPKVGEKKSSRLMDFAPILTTPDIMFINLQYGDCAADLAEVYEKLGVEIFQDPEVDQLTDMDIFFAQVAALDLVITTSNTSAHTAGSQNAPVWILLPAASGQLWYWFLHRTESPWYPSARIFRAGASTSWSEDAAAQAGTALGRWLEASPGAGEDRP